MANESWTVKRFLKALWWIIVVTGPIIGLGALIVGLIHIQEITRVEQALSTRSIPNSDQALKDMIRVINAAQGEVFVVSDFPGYYDYTSPTRAGELQQAISSKIGKQDVHLVFLTEAGRSQSLALVFPKKNWRSLSKKPEMLTYLRKHLANVPSNPSYEDLIRAARDGDQQAIAKFRGATDTSYADDLEVLCWIGDHEAVFAIVSFIPDIDDQAFKTSDKELIAALREMARHFHANYIKRQALVRPPI